MVATALKSIFDEGWTDLQKADFVLKFVQLATQYRYDSATTGYNEFWKYSIEILCEMNGDCENTPIFYASLMNALDTTQRCSSSTTTCAPG